MRLKTSRSDAGGGGGLLFWGGGGGGVGPAMRVALPWSRWRRRRPQAPARGRRPPLPLVGGRKGQRPPRPIALAPDLPSPPGQPGGQAPGASWAWGCLAPMPRRGGCPAFWEGPCTGVSPGGPSPGGPGRPGGPAPAERIARPLLRAGPQGRAPGILARPRAGLSDSAGPHRGRCVLRGPPGSSG